MRGLRWAVAFALTIVFTACVTDPTAPIEPGTEKWYVQRLQEIEAAKAAGQLTEEQYLSLKNEADATRSARLNAVRYNDPFIPYGFGPIHDYSYH